MKNKFFSLVPLNVVIKLSYKSVSGFAVKSGQRKAQVTETKETNFSGSSDISSDKVNIK